MLRNAKFVQDFVDTAANMYRLGWDERNGGNISMLVDEADAAPYVDLNKVIRNIPLGFDAKALAGKYFLVTGTGKYLKQMNPEIKVVAVEPEGSPVLSGGKAGTHGLQGIGAGFVPDILDRSIIDEVMCVNEQQAYAACRTIAATEGVLTGISSGAAAHAAARLAQREENAGKLIVALLPDGGEKYMSMGLFGGQGE